jgi:hypothetical protein
LEIKGSFLSFQQNYYKAAGGGLRLVRCQKNGGIETVIAAETPGKADSSLIPLPSVREFMRFY